MSELGLKGELPRVPGERIKHYRKKAQLLLDKRGYDFGKFSKDHEVLTGVGDELILKGKSTGYNLLLSESEMHLVSKEQLIFYSNYVVNTMHFGLLLAEMEYEKVIREDQIKWGNKASSVLYKGWKISDSESEKLRKVGDLVIVDTVETVVTFRLDSDDQVIPIVKKLYERADWDVPDFRATLSLEKELRKIRFKRAYANILRFGDAQLIVLNDKPIDLRDWIPNEITVNPELASYLSAPRL